MVNRLKSRTGNEGKRCVLYEFVIQAATVIVANYRLKVSRRKEEKKKAIFYL